MKKAIIALGLAMVMFLGISYIYAQEQSDPPRHGWMHGEKSWGQGKRFNLTDEQKEKFQELRRKFIEQNAQLIGELMAKRLELRSLWTDPKADSKTILAKEREFGELKNQMRDKAIQRILEVRNSLTPEQIEKFGMMRGIGLGFGHPFEMGRAQGMGGFGMWR